MEHIDYVVAIFTTLFTVAGMQFKNMKYILVSQIAANGLLGLQCILGGTISSGYITFFAVAQTIASFIFSWYKKSFPVWLTLLFCAGYGVITYFNFTNGFDILTCIAACFFALGIVQKNSAVCRVFSFMNVTLWLIYDIMVMPSGILSHGIIICFITAAIIRLDRNEWKRAFAIIFRKGNSAPAEAENTAQPVADTADKL